MLPQVISIKNVGLFPPETDSGLFYRKHLDEYFCEPSKLSALIAITACC